MDITLIIGSAGALILLIAFALNEIGRLEQDTYAYSVLNLVGALLVLTYAVLISSVPYMILESVWAGVAFLDIAGRLAGKGKSG